MSLRAHLLGTLEKKPQAPHPPQKKERVYYSVPTWIWVILRFTRLGQVT